MTTRTQHYNLDKIGKGESIAGADGSYKYAGADRDLIDLLLWLGAEAHHHTGGSAVAAAPASPPTLLLDQSAGTLRAGTRIYYKYTYVNDQGMESLPSPESYIDTPFPVVDSGAPALTLAVTGGTLLPGQHNYVLSAYRQASTLETKAINFANILIPAPGTTNKVTLTLPSLPSGAHGFNVYRRKPGSTAYYWIAMIDMTVITPPTTFVDNGSYADDCARTLPNANRTNSQNNIRITLPGATPTVPVGSTWKVYRTYVSGDYRSSTLHHVVEETSEGSGIITPTYLDLGYATSLGNPPIQGISLSAPDPIDFTDAAEIQGTAPPANLVFKEVVQFAYTGTLATAIGTFSWRCPYEKALIKHVSISLGRGSSASGSDDIVDVNKHPLGVSGVTIFTDQTKRPRITSGNRASADKIPDVRALVKGDELSVDIDQVGGTPTPTDADLLVQIVIWHMDTTALSIVFS